MQTAAVLSQTMHFLSCQIPDGLNQIIVLFKIILSAKTIHSLSQWHNERFVSMIEKKTDIFLATHKTKLFPYGFQNSNEISGSWMCARCQVFTTFIFMIIPKIQKFVFLEILLSNT